MTSATADASMRPRLGGAERHAFLNRCSCLRPASMRPRLGGAERGVEGYHGGPAHGLQCGRAWGARRGSRTPAQGSCTSRFNAAAPGGRGEGRGPRPRVRALPASMRPRLGGAERVWIGWAFRTLRQASMRPRLGGAERPPRPGSTLTPRALQCGRAWGARRGPRPGASRSRWTPLQCGRAWGARRGHVAFRLVDANDRFNAAAPGGRGEDTRIGQSPEKHGRFNAAAPGGRGEDRAPGRSPTRLPGFNAAAPGGRGEAEKAAYLVWRFGASMRPRLGGAERHRGAHESLEHGPASMRPRLGGAERLFVVRSKRYTLGLQCGRAWGARRGHARRAPP